MGSIAAHDPVVRAAAARCWRETIAGKGCRNALWLLVAMASMTTPGYAADTSGGDGGGYYGQYYEPGDAVAPDEAVAAEGLSRQTQYDAPDAGGLLYQPGFRGCAPSARQSLGGGGLRTALVTLPPAPAPNRGRYFRLGLTVAEIYTDNVTLASDENAESDYVTQVVPSIEACANSGRIKAALDYQLQALYYINNSQFNDIYHNVSGATTIEVLPGHLFLDADSSYGQAVIDPSSTFSETNLVRPGNRTSAWISNVSPYWLQQLGPVGRATLRYRYGRAEYGSSDVSDYTLHGVYFNLINPPTNTLWSYQVSVASQRVERDDVDSGSLSTGPFGPLSSPSDEDRRVTYFDRATLQLGYQLTESLQLLAMGGVENDYQADGSVDRYGSALWNVGFRWASVRNSLEARYGHRSFGSSYSVEAAHRSANFDLSLAYEEDTTAAGLNQLNRGAVGGAGAFPSPVTSIQDQGVYVSKRLSATLGYDSARTRTTFQAYDESREYVRDNVPDEDVYGADLQVRYQAGVRTSVIPQVGWEHRASDQQEADIAEAGISVVYLLSSSSQAALSYSHGWRDAETEADSYEENRIVVQYSVYF